MAEDRSIPANQRQADTKKSEGQDLADQTTRKIKDQLSNVADKVVARIEEADSILVALSQNPSVDEMAAAIGLTMLLDRAGKHATAIYSGETPNALEFLKPDETFEPDTNSLQDFIIALNKDKADHLRYKIEGDFVKVYITPYRTTLTEKDLEFSHGDFNVDLVVAFDVETGEDLDGALSEYGRIMHDATAINITTGEEGRFAEVEWSEPEASSVCEMVVKLADLLKVGDGVLDAEVATALLTGIVAATERFSNERTKPETMGIASRLMGLGADQQLISSNLTKGGEDKSEKTDAAESDEAVEGEDDNGNEATDGTEPSDGSENAETNETRVNGEEEGGGVATETKTDEDGQGSLVVGHEEVNETPAVQTTSGGAVSDSANGGVGTFQVPEVPATEEKAIEQPKKPEFTIPDMGETQVGVQTPGIDVKAVYGEASALPGTDTSVLTVPSVAPVTPEVKAGVAEPANPLAGAADLTVPSPMVDRSKDYGAMMDAALTSQQTVPAVPDLANTPPVIPQGVENTGTVAPQTGGLPMPDGTVLPPPPTPPMDFNVPQQ